MNIRIGKAVNAFKTTYKAEMGRAVDNKSISPNPISLISKDLFGDAPRKLSALREASEAFVSSFGK